MNLGFRLFLIFGGLIFLIGLIIFVLYPIFNGNDSNQSAEENNQNQITQNTNLPSRTELFPDPASEILSADQNDTILNTGDDNQSSSVSDSAQKAELQRLSRLFIERFGSYSNFAEFKNITSLQGLMTSSMQNYTNGLIANQSNQNQSEYIGVTTKLLTQKFSDFQSEQSAILDFSVQQSTQIGLDGEIKHSTKTGTIQFNYNNNQWLIDGLFYN